MSPQTDGQRRNARREAKQRSRRRHNLHTYWRAEFGGDLEAARERLAADDSLAVKFSEEADGYPWPERGSEGVMSQASYEDACNVLELAVDECAFTVDLGQEAKRGDRSQDDIDRAEVDGWADMQREACNALAKVKRELWSAGDPPILDHDEVDCGRCGWKTLPDR